MITALNTQFGIAGQLSFREDASGLVIADISNAQASASLCLQGAHLMTWKPHSQAVPLIWLSRDAKLAPGKSIRGGVPICWPWFGAHATEPTFPGHGHARTVSWQVIGSGTEACGATRLVLRIAENPAKLWAYPCTLELTVIAGETLRMALSTTNTGSSDFVIGEALHTYFQIGDIAQTRVGGLSGCTYWDKVGGSALRKQQGEIGFEGETDRVYIDSADSCTIVDPLLKRRIIIDKTDSLSTVVWTPWTTKAEKMGDLGQPDGWREMVCVESGNALENTVRVAAGSTHTLRVEYRAEAL